MHTLTVQITDSNAIKILQDLHEKHLIRIMSKPDLDSPSMPGDALSLQAFKNWIKGAENTSTVSLKDAKSTWANKRKQLQSIAR